MNIFIWAASVLFTVFAQTNISEAAIQGKETASLHIRAGDHGDFSRIVLEGPKNLISQGMVSNEGKTVYIRFSDPDFTLKHQVMHVPCKRNNDTIEVSLRRPGELKVYTLEDPSRIVIDVFEKAPGAETEDKGYEAGKADIRVTAKEEKRSLIKIPGAGINNNTKRQGNHYKTAVSLFSSVAEAAVVQETDEMSQTNPERKHNGISAEITAAETNDEYGFIPEKYQKIWQTYKKDNNPYKAISELSDNKPSDVELLAVYHFINGEALSSIKRYLEAIEHLRLGYIYTSNEKLKEVSLLKRANVYEKIGFIYEAKNNYSVFIRDYPSSRYLSEAHLGMANSLSEIGYLSEAVKHYRLAGHSAEVMFNMANALQKLEKVDEARKAYANAMLVDKGYPEKSPETYYLLAENLRMSGKLFEAKKMLSTINSGLFRDSARVSLGLIEMEENNNEEAIAYFQTVVFTRNIKVKVKALFNLSLAFLKTGKLKESISTLEEVRKNYPDSSMYDEALLVLSRLYRHEGRIKESVSLLKELVYGNRPPQEAFSELEIILLEASEKTDPCTESGLCFTDLWREVGQWMLDESRGDFLLKMAKRLKPEGKPFLQLCSWLTENTSGNVKLTAALDLADYYAGLEDIRLAEKYFETVKDTNKGLKVRQSNDLYFKLEAIIKQGNKNTEDALKNIMSVKEFYNGEYRLLAKIISDLKKSGSKNLNQALSFYEKMINKFDGGADDYIRLADIYYDIDEEKALKYYRTAYEKNSKDEWAIYRIGLIVDMPETGTMLSQLQNGDNLLSRMAKTKLKEINLLNKINEVYQ